MASHYEEKRLRRFDAHKMYWRQVRQKKSVHNLADELSKWLAEQRLGKIAEKQILLTSTKDTNLWRTSAFWSYTAHNRRKRCRSWDDIFTITIIERSRQKKKKKLVIGSVPARLEIGEVKSDAQAKNIPVKKIARNGSMYNKTLLRNSIPDAKIKSLHKFIAELIGY